MSLVCNLSECLKIWNSEKNGVRLYWCTEHHIFVACTAKSKQRAVLDAYPSVFRLVDVKRHPKHVLDIERYSKFDEYYIKR